MAKIIEIDNKDSVTVSDFVSGIDPVNALPIITGTHRSVQDWQLEKHMTMLEADMTAAQKTKAQAIIAKFKK